MGAALRATGRPILYSICSWGQGNPHTWGAAIGGHSWRTGRDVFATFSVESEKTLGLPTFLQSVMSSVDVTEPLAPFAGPGHFNDLDMLLVGIPGMSAYGVPGIEGCPPAVPDCTPGEAISRERWGVVGGLTPAEARTHFALWAMMAAPLVLGNDVRHMDAETQEILTAPGVLAISQDPLVWAGRRCWRAAGEEVWCRKLADGSVALLLFNARSNATANVTAVWERDVEPLTLPPRCVDQERWCAARAATGECELNSAFMKPCEASCPKLCAAAPPPPPPPPGPELRALVVDAWTGKRLGVLRHGITLHRLPPHASRLLVVTLVHGAGHVPVLAGAGEGVWAESVRKPAPLSGTR